MADALGPWKRLFARAALLALDLPISAEAMKLLLLLLKRASVGEPSRISQEDLAAELGCGVSVLRRAVRDLVETTGFVHSPQPLGSSPTEYAMDLARLQAWVGGRFVVRKSQDYSFENESTNEGLSFENRSTTSRARGDSSSSSSFSPSPDPSKPASMESPLALQADTQRMAGILRRFRIPVSPGLVDDVIHTLWAGHFSVAEVEAATRTAAMQGVLKVSYIEAIMRGERAASGVTEMSGWQGGAAI